MRLGEALAQRAEATKRVEQLRTRIAANARYQEGDTPAEVAADLLHQAEETLDELESLIRRINRTNSAASLGDGTISDALARRDVLRMRHATVVSAADAAAGRDGRLLPRQLRSELLELSALPVGQLRADADTLARELRQLDSAIQRTNWEVELLD